MYMYYRDWIVATIYTYILLFNMDLLEPSAVTSVVYVMIVWLISMQLCNYFTANVFAIEVLNMLCFCLYKRFGVHSYSVPARQLHGNLYIHALCVSIIELWHVGPLTVIAAWINNYIHYKALVEITYPFANFIRATVEVWEWIRILSQTADHAITFSCWD